MVMVHTSAYFVVSNVVLGTTANSLLRWAATSQHPFWTVFGAFSLNSGAFAFWYLLLSRGEGLSTTQIVVSSSMIVMSCIIAALVFSEPITPMHLLGGALALSAVGVMSAASTELDVAYVQSIDVPSGEA
tara:strand:+ start:321 stop:710 length:390 start_codon:yes stop_codon:yes gene_type:complete